MNALKVLSDLGERVGLEFIVCGGHAVNAYQVIRKTGDIDLIVRASQAQRWRDELVSLGYSVFHETDAFLQLQAVAVSDWPIDLLVVDEQTFDTMKQAATLFPFGGVRCLIPSLEHLIAMKLHALRFSGEHRMRKDAVDIVDLAERGELDLEGDRFRALCERFADARVYERILQYAGKKV